MAAAPGFAGAELTAALRRHPPFDEMDAASLQWLAGRLHLAYYPRGELVVGPESGVAGRLLIVKQGRVRGSGGGLERPAADVVLGEGECFPISALIGARATVYAYRAESDCFCWELAQADFRALLERSARFRAFCTGQLALLVERSHRALRAEAGEALADGAGMLSPLRGALARAPVSCAPDTPVREVLRAMHAQRVGSMVVVDSAQVPLGIFTTLDVLGRVAAPQAAVDGPISALMTPEPVTLEEEATLADAALAMARHGIRHVVVTRDGRLAGVVSERDLFALQRGSVRRSSERIRAAGSLDELVGAADEVRRLARLLLAQGVAAEQLTALVSALNDALSQRLIELAARRHALADGWCWLALGSEGRLEQTFATDQDNALIVPAGTQAAFLRFADEVNQGLAACGFPLCTGDVMARNPKWCLEPADWRQRFAHWIEAPQPQALLDAAIFFDFRALAGEARLAGELRDAVLALAGARPAFLRALAECAVKVRPPLGLLRDFALDAIDLKMYGARPLVDAARVLALAHGHPETSTAARLRGAGEPVAVEAFHYIQGLRLRHGNLVRVDALNAIDQRILKEAFRQAVLLQERLRLDYSL